VRSPRSSTAVPGGLLHLLHGNRDAPGHQGTSRGCLRSVGRGSNGGLRTSAGVRSGSSARPSGTELLAIKGVHTLIFLGELSSIAWLVVTGLLNRRDRTVVAAAAMVAGETAVFVANRGTCPLTPLAERYGAARGSVSDIFLPDLVARTIPIWAGALVAVAVALHARGAWRDARSRLHGSMRGAS